MALSNARRGIVEDARAFRGVLTVASFLAVPLLLYSIWVVWPTLYTFYLSLTKWDGYSAPEWYGFQNYLDLLGDNEFKRAVLNNLVWMLVFITVPTVAGLALAVVLNTSVRFDRFLKISYYLPLVMPPVVTALIWSWIYIPTGGLLNSAIFGVLSSLKAIGLPVNPQSAFENAWLGDPKLALGCVLAAAIWRQVGYVMILYLAGLKTVDAEVIEAAKVDGAEGWAMFRYVVLPMLTPVTTIVAVISVIDSLRSFDIVNVMTKGGPVSATEVLANYMYVKAFDDNRMGYGASVAVVLFAISACFIFIYLRRVLADEDRGSA